MLCRHDSNNNRVHQSLPRVGVILAASRLAGARANLLARPYRPVGLSPPWRCESASGCLQRAVAALSGSRPAAQPIQWPASIAFHPSKPKELSHSLSQPASVCVDSKHWPTAIEPLLSNLNGARKGEREKATIGRWRDALCLSYIPAKGEQNISPGACAQQSFGELISLAASTLSCLLSPSRSLDEPLFSVRLNKLHSNCSSIFLFRHAHGVAHWPPSCRAKSARGKNCLREWPCLVALWSPVGRTRPRKCV